MGRRKESIFDVFTEISWQTSVFLAAAVFIVLRFILPLIPMQEQLIAGIADTLREHAHLIGLILLVPAPFSAAATRRRKKQLAAQRNINSIRELDRWQVEQLVAETYRRRGYTVMFERNGGLDGASDLRLQKGGRMHLARSSRWNSLTVDAADIRELFEVMTAERAAGGMVITSGTFTPDAKRFAAGKSIELIGLERLAALTNER